MRFLAAVFSLVTLVITYTLADIVNPEGYWVKGIWPVPRELQSKAAINNPNTPLLNAILDCYKAPGALWYEYEPRGYRWDGVSEKEIKAAANAGKAAMSKWCSAINSGPTPTAPAQGWNRQ
jgi:hypothetical protein